MKTLFNTFAGSLVISIVIVAVLIVLVAIICSLGFKIEWYRIRNVIKPNKKKDKRMLLRKRSIQYEPIIQIRMEHTSEYTSSILTLIPESCELTELYKYIPDYTNIIQSTTNIYIEADCNGYRVYTPSLSLTWPEVKIKGSPDTNFKRAVNHIDNCMSIMKIKGNRMV